jgi:hypothetical protein
MIHTVLFDIDLYCFAGGRCRECRRKAGSGNDKKMHNVAVR